MKVSKQIEKIDLSYCINLTGDCFGILHRNCQSLKHLNLQCFTKENLSMIAMPWLSLETLNITGWNSIKDISIRSIAQFCLNIQQIACTSLHVCDETIKLMAMNCTKLTTIHITSYSPIITDDILLTFAQHNDKLTDILFAWCGIFTSDMFAYFIRKQKEIKSLSIIGNRNFTDETLILMSPYLTHLNSLDLSFCKNLTVSVSL